MSSQLHGGGICGGECSVAKRLLDALHRPLQQDTPLTESSVPSAQVAALKAQAEEQQKGHEVLLTGVRADLDFWQARALAAEDAKAAAQVS